MSERVKVELVCPCGATLSTELVSGFTVATREIINRWLSDHKLHEREVDNNSVSMQADAFERKIFGIK